jgi:hypothetical protein
MLFMLRPDGMPMSQTVVPIKLWPKDKVAVACMQGQLELGDYDEPLNAWLWGPKAEFFQYTMVGTHTTQSGGCTRCVCAMTQVPSGATATGAAGLWLSGARNSGRLPYAIVVYFAGILQLLHRA